MKADGLSSALSFAGIGLHDNLSMINNSLFSHTDWNSTPIPASTTSLNGADSGADLIAQNAAEAWGKSKINHDQPWHNNDGERSEDDDPMVWKSKPNNGTDLWEKSTGRKVNWMVNNDGPSRGKTGDSSDFGMQRQMTMQQGGSQQPVPSWLREDSNIDMFGGGPSSGSSASVTPTSNMGPPAMKPSGNAWNGPASNRMGGGGGFADDGTPTPTNNHTPNATPAISHWGGDQHDGGFQQNSGGWNAPHNGPPPQAWNNRPVQQPRGDAWGNNGGATHNGGAANWQGNRMMEQKSTWGGGPMNGMPPPPLQQRPNFMPPRGLQNMASGNNNMPPPNLMNGNKQMPPPNMPWNPQCVSPNHMQTHQGQRMGPPMPNLPMNGMRPNNNFGPAPPQPFWGQPNNTMMMNKPPGPMSPNYNGMPQQAPAGGGSMQNASYGLWNNNPAVSDGDQSGIGSPTSNNGVSLNDSVGSVNDIWSNDTNGKPDNQWSDWSSGRTSSGYASDNNGSGNASGAKSSMAAEQHNNNGFNNNNNSGPSSSNHSPVNGTNSIVSDNSGSDGTHVWQKKSSPVTNAGGDGWAASWSSKNNMDAGNNGNKQTYNGGNGSVPSSLPLASGNTGSGGGGNNSPAETQQSIAHELYSLIKEGFLNREEVSLSRNNAEQSQLLNRIIVERRKLATFKVHRDQIHHPDPQQAEMLRNAMSVSVRTAEQEVENLMKQYKFAGNKLNNVLIQPPPLQHDGGAAGPPPSHIQQFSPFPQQQSMQPQMNSLCNSFSNSLSMSHQNSNSGAGNFDNGFSGGGGGFFSGGGGPAAPSAGGSSFGGGGGGSGGGLFGMNNASSGFNTEFGTAASVW